MRQAGVLAAAGLYALEHHRARLGEDHLKARRLAELLGQSKGVRPSGPVDTNIVIADLVEPAPTAADLVARARAEGVLLNSVGPRRIRLVTHLDVSLAECERAAAILSRL